MVLKGTAMVQLHYKDLGLRPMSDLDLLVRPERALEAINLLTRLGWIRARTVPDKLSEAYLSVSKGHSFYSATGRDCDLHWHVLGASSHSDAEANLWEGAVRTSIGDEPTLALNPSDQLLHLCTHGTRWSKNEYFYWLADVIVVLQTSLSQIDWDRLVSLAYEFRSILPVIDGLTCVREVLDGPVPEEVLRRLRGMPVARIEREVYAARVSRADARGPVIEFKAHYLDRHPRSGGRSSLFRDIITFIRFTQYYWQVDHWWQVFTEGARMAVGKVLGGSNTYDVRRRHDA
jgi:hypothetical protein